MVTRHHNTNVRSPDTTRDSPMFSELSSSDVDIVLSRATLREGRRGAFLFRQGEPAKQLCLLASGRVRLHDSATEHRDLLVRFVGPNGMFADKALIPG